MNTRTEVKEASEERRGDESAALLPPVDVFEDKDGITLHADLPGVSREDLAISVEGDTLTIEGQVRLGEAAAMRSVYAEIGVDRYRRSFMLSGDLDTTRIDAQLRSGVVTLRVPKREQAKPRRVEVRAEG